MPKPKKNKCGTWKLVVNFNYKRTTLTLGILPKSEVDLFAANIAVLVSHKKQFRDRIPPQLDSWVVSLSRKHREQLGGIGLLSRFDASLTVGDLIEIFLREYESRPTEECADSTKRQFRSAMENRIPERLKKRFVSEIEPKREHHRPNAEPLFHPDIKAIFRDVESWQRNHFAKATWSRANGRIREIGVWAVKNGVCDYNPFVLLPKPGETNEERNVHVEQVWVDDAMDMCLHPDIRLFFAVGRYAGFRTPSEARTLKPSHVDFEKSKLQIFDSKKKRFRSMPLFDRIREEFIRHREQTGWKGRFVLGDATLSTADANNYNLMKEAIARTQWSLWTRLRQNLRASFENDLLNQGFDERLVTLWIGHSIKVSRKHYQKQSDSDYLRAIEKSRGN